jgi:hypothetical protein
MAGCADQLENDFRIVLGAIVLIRTIISFSLNAELESEKHALTPVLAHPARDGAGRPL